MVSPVKSYRTATPEETRQRGETIGQNLKPGDILLLFGELGSGKTTFIQGLARGLKVTEYVTSPSFIIVSEHAGPVKLYHVDLYRLTADRQDIEDLGLDEYFDSPAVTVVEWAERLGDSLPKKFLRLDFAIISETERRITATPYGGAETI